MQKVLDSVGKPVWLGLMAVGFIWWWPAGLAVLSYLVWTNRLGASVSLKPWMPQFWGSGNMAFDEHKAEMLKQLEAEQTDFASFIEDLKKAKDKGEFDQFMAKRAK
jgi:hypothetical protein